MINVCLWPQWEATPIMCRKCNQPMALYPISKREIPLYWDCTKSCKRKLFCSEIIEAFQQAQIKIEEEELVSVMAFAMDSREIRLSIESIEYIGDSRNKSTLRYLTQGQKDSIQDELLDYICSILSIDVEDFSDLWQQ